MGYLIQCHLQLHHIHIRIPLLKPQRLIQRIGLRARGVRGKAKINRGELAASEVDNPLQERAADPLPPIGRQDHDILHTRLPPRRRLKHAQRGTSNDMLFIVLRDEDSRSRRCHRTLLLQRRDFQLGVQLFHKSQQISNLGVA